MVEPTGTYVPANIARITVTYSTLVYFIHKCDFHLHCDLLTSSVDREERALGNDPEKELREKEAFQTYERAEEPPLRGSRCSLNDDSAEIGSDGDGELDDYNLDPGKFNEEGSFIGEYATERHKGPSNRLPTLDRNYNPTV
ncbi:unnamed protein product [Schistosoma curassoni]|uniref:Bravo_FIGEY domain-containing protein n=1 Tax=Schistosoma curassoni TaxID=6186 RepID=A0A183KWQ8_9TREM|nr:unnamed protein product [Schistosoma curassoni]